MVRVLVAVFFVLFTISASAQQAKVCVQITDDEMRLQCYDGSYGYEGSTASGSTTALVEPNVISTTDLSQNFGSNSTEAQRVVAWEKIEDKDASVSGRVRDVDTPGLLSEYYQVTLSGPDSMSFYCDMNKRYKTLAASLRVGDRFTCTGFLKSYIFMFGGAGITIIYDE